MEDHACYLEEKILSFNDGKIKVYHGDCKELLDKIEPESIDLVVSSPPYCIGKEYEKIEDDLESFRENHEIILPRIIEKIKPNGSLCWQIGYHVKNSSIFPLDYIVYDIIEKNNRNSDKTNKMVLRNRIIWTFGHGFNSEYRLSGRHEMILWFTKGDGYTFNLDDIRIPQKYPGKTYHKGVNKGRISGNPLGKNPSDVWDIPNVKANHVEKTDHPCQFPIAIPQRLIRALTDEGDIVLDPYVGSGTTAASCVLENRRFIGAEIKDSYIDICKKRITDAINGDLRYREDKPVMEPNPNSKVATKPEGFLW